MKASGTKQKQPDKNARLSNKLDAKPAGYQAQEDSTYLFLKYEGTTSAIPEEPDAFLYEIDGEVMTIAEDDDEVLVGRFKVYYADFEAALNNKTSIFDVLDTHAETVDYYDPVYGGPADSPSAELERLLGEPPIRQNLLIFDRLEILSEYRSRNIGL